MQLLVEFKFRHKETGKEFVFVKSDVKKAWEALLFLYKDSPLKTSKKDWTVTSRVIEMW